MTLIERAARAMADNLESHEENWQGYVHCVRAVLREIREPSEAMIERGISDGLHNQPSGDNPDTDRMATDTWQAMIDAALSEAG